jgi:hypothetical protein
MVDETPKSSAGASEIFLKNMQLEENQAQFDAKLKKVEDAKKKLQEEFDQL